MILSSKFVSFLVKLSKGMSYTEPKHAQIRTHQCGLMVYFDFELGRQVPFWSNKLCACTVVFAESDDGIVDWDLLDDFILFEIYDENQGTHDEFLGQV